MGIPMECEIYIWQMHLDTVFVLVRVDLHGLEFPRLQ